jgi:hypothetical protein
VNNDSRILAGGLQTFRLIKITMNQLAAPGCQKAGICTVADESANAEAFLTSLFGDVTANKPGCSGN